MAWDTVEANLTLGLPEDARDYQVAFAEMELCGVEATAVMPLVGDHLDKCADCRSKFEALLTALRGR